jgi:hypothetical protein
MALALAWEYLRRHPDYRRDWLRRRRRPMRRIAGACACWKIRPGCARRASGLVPRSRCRGAALPDADPPPDAHAFAFWRIPATSN